MHINLLMMEIEQPKLMIVRSCSPVLFTLLLCTALLKQTFTT